MASCVLTCTRFKSYSDFPPRNVRLLEKTDVEKVLLRFSRYGMTGWQRKRNPNLPAPMRAQLDAIDAVQFTYMLNAFTIPSVKGDLLFVNDTVVMHARHGFEEQGQYMKRHLLKMFLRDPEQNWPLSPSAEEARQKMYGPNQADGTRKEIWNVVYKSGLEEDSPMNG